MIRSILLCALGGIAASASASSQQSNEAPAGEQPYWIEQAKAAAQLQGITVGEAVRRQRLQERAELQNERFSEDPDYVGARFENGGPELRVRFYFKQGASAKTIGDPDLSGIASIERLPLSRAELNQQRVAVQQAARQAGMKLAVVMESIDQRILLFPEDPARFNELVKDGKVELPASAVVKNEPLKVTPEAAQAGGKLMTGTRASNNYTYRCVSGFSVISTSSTTTGIATAGHCEDLPEWDLKTLGGTDVGIMMGERDYADGMDVSWFRKTGDTYAATVVNTAGTYPIKLVAPQIPGVLKPVCVVRKDGSQSCAYTHTEFYFSATDGPYISLDRDNLTEVGDSGAPWFYVDKAYGIHSGNVTWDGKSRDFYSPAANLPRMGIRVITQ